MALNNLKTLAYNILKSLEDNAVRDIEFSELGPCTECDNEILSLPLKALTLLSCGHVFHRLCIEKKLLLAETGVCPFPDCKRSVDIIGDANTRRETSLEEKSPETPREEDDQEIDDGVVLTMLMVMMSMMEMVRRKKLKLNPTNPVPLPLVVKTKSGPTKLRILHLTRNLRNMFDQTNPMF
ncbi:unnamed protein product [Rhizophagus irregularis]|nr:unnamed protein product [Rhizophagus irregularis]